MNILSLFVIGNSLLSIMRENIIGVLLTILFLILFSYPLGNVVLVLVLKKRNSFLSTSLGLLLNMLIMYWIIVLNIPWIFFPLLLLSLCLYLYWRTKNITTTKIIFSKKMKILFLFLSLYYLIPPLTWDYAFAREYDLFAVGLKQSNEFRLPLVESYYSPAIAILPAFMSKIISFLTINKIMINIYSLLPLFLVVFLYFFGKEALENEELGFFFAVAYAITAVSKNAIFGGSAWPALLSLVYSLASFFFFFTYIKTNDKKNLLLCACMGAGAMLSHIDTALVLAYAYISLMISCLFFTKTRREIFKVFFIIGISAALVISPFLVKSIENKEKLQELWTEEKWMEQQHGEAHVKSFQEIMFSVGRISVFIAFFGLLYCIKKIKKQENIFPLFLLLWSLVMVLQNSWSFVKLSKLILPYYPLNIIMWMDLAILLSFLGGYALFHLEALVKPKYFTKVFIICTLVLVLFSYVSFETVNAEKIYPDQGGYLKRGFIAKGDYVSRGDMGLMKYLKDKEGIILNNNLIVGTAIPAMSEQESYTHIYEESYFDPAKKEFFEERRKDIEDFFADPVAESSFAFVKDKNISFIFLANEQTYEEQRGSYYYNPSLIESGNYSIIMRSNGAKIMVLKNSGMIIKHFEVEEYTNGLIKQYSTPAMVAKTVKMDGKTKIVIPKTELQTFLNKNVTLYIKYTSFKNIPVLAIQNGNDTYLLEKETTKIQFTEANASFVIKDTDLVITTKDDMLFLPIEIDWVEIETEKE